METSIAFWIAAIFASIFVGLGKGGLPVVAALAVPSLSLFMSPIAAAGLLLPVYIVSDMFALVAYRKEYDARVLKIAFFGMTLGVLLGGLTAHLILEWLITFLIGLMGTVFALRMLMTRPKDDLNTTVPARYGTGLFWTTIAGFTSFISHNGGPPMANIHAAAKFTEIGLCRNLGDHIFLCELHKTLSLYIIGTGHVHERKNLTIPAGACGDCSLRGGRCG